MQHGLPEALGQDATEARFLQELDSFAGMLSTRNLAPLPDDLVQELFALPHVAALQCLRGACAAHVRSPVGLLKWKLSSASNKISSPSACSSGSPDVSKSSSTVFPAALQTPSRQPLGDERSASPSTADGAPADNSASKRPHDATADESQTSANKDANQPRHRCPGCGLEGPVGTVGHQTTAGVLEAMWGRHGCGASWMITSVPRGFAAGGLLNVWIPQQTGAPPPGNHDALAASPTSRTPLPRCTSCGTVLRDILLGVTGDPNKWVTHLRCDGCSLVLFGSMTHEGSFVHFCLCGRRGGDA